MLHAAPVRPDSLPPVRMSVQIGSHLNCSTIDNIETSLTHTRTFSRTRALTAVEAYPRYVYCFDIAEVAELASCYVARLSRARL